MENKFESYYMALEANKKTGTYSERCEIYKQLHAEPAEFVTVYKLYALSRDAGNAVIDIGDAESCLGTNAEYTLKALRKFGFNRITLSERSTHVLTYAAQIEKQGWTLVRLTTAKRIGGGEVPALHFVEGYQYGMTE